MESELIYADRPEQWNPWAADEELYYGIMTGLIQPPSF